MEVAFGVASIEDKTDRILQPRNSEAIAVRIRSGERNPTVLDVVDEVVRLREILLDLIGEVFHEGGDTVLRGLVVVHVCFVLGGEVEGLTAGFESETWDTSICWLMQVIGS